MYNPSSTIKFRKATECFGRGCSPMSPEQSIKDPVAKRISGGGEPDPERADQGSAAAFGRRKSNTGRVRKALADVAATAKPETILGWYRKLIANKFDGSKSLRRVGQRYDFVTRNPIRFLLTVSRCFLTVAACREKSSWDSASASTVILRGGMGPWIFWS